MTQREDTNDIYRLLHITLSATDEIKMKQNKVCGNVIFQYTRIISNYFLLLL